MYKIKSYKKELTIEVPIRRAFVTVTYEVESRVRESRVQEGLVHVNAKKIKLTTSNSQLPPRYLIELI